ncbi:MAG: tetratricopeptide repeat protein [Synechococcales bacterium]|nr:tetratricopeptide repeat protein [Synechococcales bacterium]
MTGSASHSFLKSAQFKASLVGFSLAGLTAIGAIGQLVSLPPADALSVQPTEDHLLVTRSTTDSPHTKLDPMAKPRSPWKNAQTRQERYNEAWGYQQAGDWLRQKGQTKAAREQYEKALPIMQELKQEKHIGVITAAIGQTYHQSKDYSRAIHYYEKALDLSPDRNEIGRVQANLAYVHRLQGNHKKAIALYQTALDQTEGDRAAQSMIQAHMAIARQEIKQQAVKPSATLVSQRQ